MIDHLAALIFNENRELLVLRKKTIDNRKECILPGGKREKNESDEETLKRELFEELGAEIKKLTYYKQYLDFQQTTYITILNSNSVNVRNEIKEALWINLEYEKKGILCNPTLKLKIIPDLEKDGFFEEKQKER